MRTRSKAVTLSLSLVIAANGAAAASEISKGSKLRADAAPPIAHETSASSSTGERREAVVGPTIGFAAPHGLSRPQTRKG